MALEITSESHVDHGLPPEAIDYLKKKYAGKSAFFIDSFTIPEGWEDLKCALRGPTVGDPPIPDEKTFQAMRGDRKTPSRMVNVGHKRTRVCTVIAGPSDGKACILYTAYGGPLAPREVADPSIADDAAALAESKAFWAEHALAAL